MSLNSLLSEITVLHETRSRPPETSVAVHSPRFHQCKDVLTHLTQHAYLHNHLTTCYRLSCACLSCFSCPKLCFVHYLLSRFAPLALFQLLHPVTCKLWRVWKETHDAPQWAAAMMAVTPRSQKRNLVRYVRNSDLWKAAHRDKPDWKSGHPPFSTCSPTACQHFNSSSAKQADQNVLVSSSFSSCAIQIPPKIDQKSTKYFSTPPTAGKWRGGSLMEKMGSALDHLFWQALRGQWRCVWRKPPSNWRKASLVALLRRPRNLQEMRHSWGKLLPSKMSDAKTSR